MRQQVNLYRGRLIDKPQPLSSRQAIPLLLLVILVLAVVGGYSRWQEVRLDQQQRQVEARLNEQRALLVQVEQQFPVRKSSALLQTQVSRLERELRQITKVLDLTLTQEQGRNAQMLSSLEGLARRTHPGLWLRQINLARQGQQVELSGRALKAQQIPEYLQWLTNEQVFTDLLFTRLQLSRMQEQPEHVDFTLTSSPGGEN